MMQEKDKLLKEAKKAEKEHNALQYKISELELMLE